MYPKPTVSAALAYQGTEVQTMPDHNYFSNLIWQIADLLRGPQYERVMLPMRRPRATGAHSRLDCQLTPCNVGSHEL